MPISLLFQQSPGESGDVPAASESCGAETVRNIPGLSSQGSTSSRSSASELTTFASLIHVPVRSRNEKAKRKSLPTFRLTSPEHYDLLQQRQTKTTKRKTRDDNVHHGIATLKIQSPPTARKAQKSTKRKRSSQSKKEKAAKKAKTGKVDHTPCMCCKKCYSSPEDDKPDDDWLECASCKKWAHETCAENWGIIGDDDYICKTCL